MASLGSDSNSLKSDLAGGLYGRQEERGKTSNAMMGGRNTESTKAVAQQTIEKIDAMEQSIKSTDGQLVSSSSLSGRTPEGWLVQALTSKIEDAFSNPMGNLSQRTGFYWEGLDFKPSGGVGDVPTITMNVGVEAGRASEEDLNKLAFILSRALNSYNRDKNPSLNERLENYSTDTDYRVDIKFYDIDSRGKTKVKVDPAYADFHKLVKRTARDKIDNYQQMI